MDEFVIQQNIQRFERLLTQTEDAPRRVALLELLSAERRKLAALCAQSPPTAADAGRAGQGDPDLT